MVSIEDTIDVPADTYSHALPDDYQDDTVEIGLTAFSDKLYIKFPRFDRSGTNDFCMDAGAIFEATVQVNDRGDLDVEPCLRRMSALRVHEDESVVVEDMDRVWTRKFSHDADMEPVHLQLVETFAATIAGFQEDDYWLGYKKGANVHGDDTLAWKDVAWTCFESRWDGDRELLLDVGKWFAREGIAVCARTKAFFPIPNWSTPTGSYVATISSAVAGRCPNCGADKSEHWECISSSNRTRVPNKYKCTDCGYQKSGITTG